MRLDRTNSILAVILTVSVLLRTAASIYLGNQIVEMPAIADQISYHTLALRLLDGFGFSFGPPWWPATRAGAPTAHWSYLYTAYLSLVYIIFGPNPLAARLIQALLVGLLQPLIVFLLARRLFNSTVGLVAAGLTAVYSYFIYFTAALMTEPFFITVVLLSLYLSILLIDRLRHQTASPIRQSYREFWLERRPVLAIALVLGVTLASAVLLRQVFLLFIPLLFLLILWYNRRRSFMPLLVISGVLLSAILPFTVYNYSRFDSFVLLNTNAGFAFFWANHPIYAHQFEPILKSSTYLSLIPADYHRLNEADLDKALLREGIQFIREDPLRYLSLSASRLPALFMFWPSPESGIISNFLRVTSFGLLWPFMLYGLLAAFFQMSKLNHINLKPALILVSSFMAFYTLLHLFSWSLVRYRLPIDAVLLVFAGFGLLSLAYRFKIMKTAPDWLQTKGMDRPYP
jgi:4-amino-4-deoxy-L-arabinose transferase-like glycosyltransferase